MITSEHTMLKTKKKPIKPSKSKIKSLDDVNLKYKKLEHKQHVLQLPDTYVGSIDIHNEPLFVLVEEGGKHRIIEKHISYIPALYKIFDEILVNAEDHWTRVIELKKKRANKASIALQPITEIRIEIDKATGQISVYNNGDGIDVELLKKNGKYPVELIFGELLTSTNYNKDEEKVIGGKNGYGAKLTNIFSTYFKVESVDRVRKKRITVEYENNMVLKEKARVEKYNKEPYTKITFIPDYKRFGIPGISDDMIALMKKRAYDVAVWCGSGVSVYLNDTLLECSSLNNYVDMYFSNPEEEPRVAEKVNERWEIVVTLSEEEKFSQVSFVNGVNTIRGGKHVEYIADQIKRTLSEQISKKHKIQVKPQYVKDQLMVFVKSQIVNPSFDSQTKETLTTPVRKFGSECKLSKKFITRLMTETDIVERVVSHAEYKNNKSLQKTDGKKKCRIKVPKLEDANWAGGKKSKECVLILTEGDSAKAMAISGLSVVGRDKYGVFPLRGKVLNVKDTDATKIGNNKEIIALKKIIGLKSEEEYDFDSKRWPLRYGKIMVMTDQDVDGSHIKGLLFNVFHELWPTLLKGDFMTSLITPIVKAFKGKKVRSFYNLTDYEKWKKKTNNGKGWRIKYYKGLGTSTSKEAKEYFTELKQVKYIWDDTCDHAIDLAFNKKRTDDRKAWLQKFDKDDILDDSLVEVSYDDFVNKELIHFSNDDLRRSVPSLCDGLKPSQRKILYSAFKRGLKKEIRVAQFAGYVSEHSSYHHGEMSLQAAIVGLAQNFVGSNNINLLNPNGQFGTRMLGGKDAGAARYIHTQINPLTSLIYHPQDRPLFNYLDDDGFKIEPDFYLPIIPMALVNGCQGIGTGYSTNIPSYNPQEIVRAIVNLMTGKPVHELVPYYRGFKGTFVKRKKGNGYISKGKYQFVNKSTIMITELPIGSWISDYKEFLDSIVMDTKPKRGGISAGKRATRRRMKASKKSPTKKSNSSKQILISYENHSTEAEVKFILKFPPMALYRIRKQSNKNSEDISELERLLKLTSTKYTNLSNIHMFDENGRICKFTNVKDIITHFYGLRLDLYVKRKQYLIDTLQREFNIIRAKVRFLEEFIEGIIEIRNKRKQDLLSMLEDRKYPKIDTTHNKVNPLYEPNYEYLIRMPIYSLTLEKKEELMAERDNKMAELEDILSKEPRELWRDDLLKFIKEYKKHYGIKTKPTRKKGILLKTKKKS